MPTANLARRRAVVVGSSIAGLLAARVLAERFAEVWLLDRDTLPSGPDARVALAFLRVAHLVAPPATLFAPAVLARVAWSGRT